MDNLVGAENFVIDQIERDGNIEGALYEINSKIGFFEFDGAFDALRLEIERLKVITPSFKKMDFSFDIVENANDIGISIIKNNFESLISTVEDLGFILDAFFNVISNNLKEEYIKNNSGSELFDLMMKYDKEDLDLTNSDQEELDRLKSNLRKAIKFIRSISVERDSKIIIKELVRLVEIELERFSDNHFTREQKENVIDKINKFLTNSNDEFDFLGSITLAEIDAQARDDLNDYISKFIGGISNRFRSYIQKEVESIFSFIVSLDKKMSDALKVAEPNIICDEKVEKVKFLLKISSKSSSELIKAIKTAIE